MSAPKPDIDWIPIEADYRAGIKTIRQIAAEHGISHGAVNKHAKAYGWDRDLQAKIRARAEDKVSRAVVSAEVAKRKLDTERTVIEVNAEVQKEVILGQRADVRAAREVVNGLMAELKEICKPEVIAALRAIIEEEPGNSGADTKRREAMLAAVGLGSRATIVQRLVDSLGKCVDLERRVFGIERAAEPVDGWSEILALVGGSGGSLVRAKN